MRICLIRCYTFAKSKTNPREPCHPKVLWETHLNLLSVQEHREEILIHDAGVAKSIAMRKRRTLQGFGDHMALCETLGCPLGGLLGVQEHRRETLICDVDVVKVEAVTYQRTP